MSDGKMVRMVIRCQKQTTYAAVKPWESWPVLTVPAELRPKINDLNMPTMHNISTNPLCFNVGSAITLRPTLNTQVPVGTWACASFCWNIA